MAERANPDIAGFKKQFKIKFDKGVIPSVQLYPSPYSEAFYWRYNWANKICKDKKVLEIPCGMGWGTSLLSLPKFVKGIDISEEAVNEAIKRYSKKNRHFEVGNMKKLSEADNTYDIVLCLEGIEHVDKSIGELFIKEAHRILKNDGRLLLSSPQHHTREHSGNPYHIHEYSYLELIQMIFPYFDIVSTTRRIIDDLYVYFIEAVVRK